MNGVECLARIIRADRARKEHECFKPVRVELAFVNPDPVSRFNRHDPVVTENSSQSGNVGLDRTACRRRRFLPPYDVDQLIGRSDPIRVEQEARLEPFAVGARRFRAARFLRTPQRGRGSGSPWLLHLTLTAHAEQGSKVTRRRRWSRSRVVRSMRAVVAFMLAGIATLSSRSARSGVPAAHATACCSPFW